MLKSFSVGQAFPFSCPSIFDKATEQWGIIILFLPRELNRATVHTVSAGSVSDQE